MCEERDELENERDRLQRALTATNSRQAEHTELVEYVQEERSIAKRREEREEMRAQAGILTKAKWAIVGMPPVESS